jgi:hypothetical protein
VLVMIGRGEWIIGIDLAFSYQNLLGGLVRGMVMAMYDVDAHISIC